MKHAHSPKGPWFHRFLIRFFTVILAVLVYWVLGFLVQDIESIDGPKLREIEKRHVDQDLIEKQKQINESIAEADRNIKSKQEEMRIVGDSSRNLQKTMSQLIELQKLAVQKNTPLPEAEQANLSVSLNHFLERQKLYQAHSAELTEATEQKRHLTDEKRAIDRRIEEQRKLACEEFRKLNARHRIRLAVLQLLILLPLLATAAFLMIRKRSSIYFPLILGCGAATLLKVALVLHRYFPSRLFKYVLVLGLLAAIVKLLVSFIRIVAFPKAEWLTKQYREAYERFLCPICEYPIRTGPRRFLFWTRRTVNKVVLPNEEQRETAYTCPSCGTTLFEECEACRGIRHSLLPFCRHCHAEKPVAGTAAPDH